MTDPTRLSDGPEYFGTQRHANDPETQDRRVLACVKCGDRHTVDVVAIVREASSLELDEIRAAVTRLRNVLGPLDPDQRQARADTLDAVLVMLEARAVR